MELIINNGILTGYRGRPVNVIIPESVTRIGDEAFGNCERLTIYGATGSYAKLYAKERKYPFKVKKK